MEAKEFGRFIAGMRKEKKMTQAELAEKIHVTDKAVSRWFRAAVLPLDGALYAEIIQSRDSVKRCAVCGAAFTPKSNRAKYCPDCAVRMRRKQEAERQRKRYLQATQLSR